jgi:hypothetical protein
LKDILADTQRAMGLTSTDTLEIIFLSTNYFYLSLSDSYVHNLDPSLNIVTTTSTIDDFDNIRKNNYDAGNGNILQVAWSNDECVLLHYKI